MGIACFLSDVCYSLNGNSLNVKIWCFCSILISHGTSNTQWGRQSRKWITLRPQSVYLVSAVTASAQMQSWATCFSWLPSKSEKLWYASFLHCNTQSRSFPERLLHEIWLNVCASLRGLCASVVVFQKSPHSYWLQVTQAPGRHSHFLATLFLSYSQFLFFGFVSLNVVLLKPFQLNR